MHEKPDFESKIAQKFSVNLLKSAKRGCKEALPIVDGCKPHERCPGKQQFCWIDFTSGINPEIRGNWSGGTCERISPHYAVHSNQKTELGGVKERH